MTRRKGNGKRGRGSQFDDGGGRARGRGRGRGRGIPTYPMDEAFDVNIQMYANAQLESPPYGGGRGGHARQPSALNSELHTPIRGRGRGFRGRGRGRGHPEMDFRNRYTDIGIGASPNVRGRGRGGGAQRLRPDAPLTSLLYEERPLLRPILFVPSTLHPVLFDQVEDLLKPGVEEVDDTEQSHLPTAAAVSRVFSGGNIQGIGSYSEADDDDSNDDDDDDDDEKEELEVVDFNDVAKLFEQTNKPKKSSSKRSSVEVVENQFIDAHSIPPSLTSSLHRPQGDLTNLDILRKRIASAAEKSHEGNGVASAVASQFYIDTRPTPIPAETVPSSLLPPSDEFDDDIIVYVAPHPRKGIQTPPERQPSTDGVPDTSEFTPYIRDASFSLAVASSSSTKATIEEEPTQPQPQTQIEISSLSAPPLSFPTPEGKTRGRRSVPPVTISRLAISRKRKKGVLRKKGGKGTRNSFRAFGAMREEAQLHDPKWKERRRGDSDLDWGDTDGSDDDDDDDSGGKHDHRLDGVESPSSVEHGNGNLIGKDKGKGKAREVDDGHGMEVDSDLDPHAMQQFVEGLLSENAGREVTMDDLRDEAEEERILEKEEDTGEDSRDIDDSLGSESDESSEDEDVEVERVLADEEAMLISETLEFEDEDLEEDDGSDDEDEDQTPRTSFQQRLDRLRKQASSSKHDAEHDISDDDDDDDDNMLERHMLFAEENGFGYNKSHFDFNAGSDEEFEYFNHKKSKRSRADDLPDDLKILWEKDRLKKAAFKKARYQARLEAAADPLSKKKGGKKGRKAMLTVASIDPTIIVLPNRIIDMVTLVQQIRRFIDDEERQTMSLPPTNKATRKNIHDLALAFNVKSLSKGNGDARYTTLTKTWKTGVLDVDENRVAKIARRKNYLRDELFVRGKARGDAFVKDKKGKKSRTGGQALVPHHREGEEVGKAAPKLGSSNLGFRMLSMMGWSEGERIGVTGGIQDPLTAIIKNTKLGLGAAK